MKRNFLLPMLLLSIALNAQVTIPNPYESIGKKANVLTLSNGRYDEFFNYDTLQRIGSVMFNLRTNKIEYFIDEKDTLLNRSMETSRWLSPDPHEAKYPSHSPYNFCLNSPLAFKDEDGQDAILIVFPDYKIATPLGKVEGLGHAGVLLIDNKTGYTKYYEYGRYDAEEKGLVRTFAVSNVVIGADGKPTTESLNKVLGQISAKAGQNGKIDGAYIISDEFNAMKNYAEKKMDENTDPNRTPYSLTDNNCGTFAADVINQDKCVDDPWIANPTPTNIVDEYQEEKNATVTYDPKTKTTSLGTGDESDAKDCE